MKRIILSVCFSTILLSAYAQKNIPFAQKERATNVQVLDFDKAAANTEEMQPLSLIADDIEFIPLETTDDCLLGADLSQIIISGDNLFVADYGQLVRFDTKGNIRNKIGRRGQGPGEYDRVWDFSVDSVNRWVYIPDHSFLKKYTYEGEFIDQVQLDFISHDVKLLNPNLMVLNHQYYEMGKISKTKPRISLYFCNPKEKKIISQLPTVMPKMPKMIFMCDAMTYMNNNSLYVKDFWSDTIFCANDPLKLKPHAVIKRENFHSIFDNEVYSDLITGEVKNQKILNISTINESSRFSILVTNQGIAVFDRAQKSQFMSTEIREEGFLGCLRDDLYGKSYVIWNFIGKSGVQDIIYSYMQPDAFLAQKTVEHKIKDARYQKFEEMTKKIKEDDNPIIMIIKLKK